MSNLNMKNSKFLIIFFCFFNISCAQNPNLASSSYSAIYSLVSDSLFKKENGISPEVIESIPYASSFINFEKSPKSLIILQSKQQDIYTWVSADSRVFLTENGRVVGTMGLPNDLYKVDRPNISFKEILSKDGLKNYVAYYSFKKPSLNNLKVEISVKVIGRKKINIFQQERELILVEERAFSKKINWKRTNRFWVDPETYFVWKSEQHISPKLPMLTFEITKKPAL
jgi:hypothetical protein